MVQDAYALEPEGQQQNKRSSSHSSANLSTNYMHSYKTGSVNVTTKIPNSVEVEDSKTFVVENNAETVTPFVKSAYGTPNLVA